MYLREARRVCDSKGHVHESREGSRQQRLARPRRSEEEDVGLVELERLVRVAYDLDQLHRASLLLLASWSLLAINSRGRSVSYRTC